MAQQPEQYFPVASMRVGPYNAMGTGIFGGVIDYLNYVNIKHGGVNGVKLVYEECETEYNAARSVECYQRLLNRGDQKMLLWDPYGTPLAYAVIGRVAADNVVLAQAGYGRTDAADGRVWPWVFGATANYWSQIADEAELHPAEGRRHREDEGQDDRAPSHRHRLWPRAACRRCARSQRTGVST